MNMSIVVWTIMIRSFMLFNLLSASAADEAFNIGDIKKSSCTEKGHCAAEKRYLLYEVNPGEGFNLRRDVYIRIAPLIYDLNNGSKSYKWILVLPPWGMLPHWKQSDSNVYLDWRTFFDLIEMRKYIPVLEYSEYLEEFGLDNYVDIIYQLQHFPFNQSEPWAEKIDSDAKCESKSRYKRDTSTGVFRGTFWNHSIYSKKAACMALRGHASTLSPLLLNSEFKSVLFDRAEVILWDNYGGSTWWAARKSLVFAQHLTEISLKFLKMSDLSPSDSLQEASSAQTEYMGVHLRRADFLFGGRKTPTIEGAAAQIVNLMTSLHLSTVFLATDGTKEEVALFRSHVASFSKFSVNDFRIVTFQCPNYITEGECAIIDQILCTRSKYFIGTEESTFTFRIFEEREILGFEPHTNFNYLCPDDSPSCKKATQWRIR